MLYGVTVSRVDESTDYCLVLADSAKDAVEITLDHYENALVVEAEPFDEHWFRGRYDFAVLGTDPY